MGKRRLWLLVLSLIMFLWGMGLPVLGNTITVTTTADEVNTNDQCSLREAIINANNDDQSGSPDCAAGSGADTIVLQPGATYTLSKDDDGGGHETDSGADNDDLDITSDITISGNGATIERSAAVACVKCTPRPQNDSALDNSAAAGRFRIFDVAGALTLENVTVRNGCAYGAYVYEDSSPDRNRNGGGIFVASGSTLTLIGSTLSGNSAYSGGGGIFVASGGTVTIINSTLSGNRAWGRRIPTGRSFSGGGGGIWNGGAVTITNSTLSGNRAQSPSCRPYMSSLYYYDGGGIRNSGMVTITNSTLLGNMAHDGSDIWNGSGGTVTITNSTLLGNMAHYGIWNGGTANLSFATIISNIHVFSGTVNIKNSIVVGKCTGTLTPSGVNLATDARCTGFTQVWSSRLNLGPLLEPQPGSAAIDAAADCTLLDGTTLTEDQRGMPRPQGSACDVGAYEAPPFPCPNIQVSVRPTSTTFSSNTEGRPNTRRFLVTVRRNGGSLVTVTDIALRPDKFDDTYTLVQIRPTLPQRVFMSRTFTIWVRKAANTPTQTVTAPYFDVQLSCGVLPASERLVPLRVEGLHTQIHAGQMRIEVAGEGIASVGLELFDLSGRKLLMQRGEGGVLTVPVSGLANGVYLAVVRVWGFDGREYVSAVKKLIIITQGPP